MSESESDKKNGGQLAATLFMEAPVLPPSTTRQQNFGVPVSPTPCLTIRKIDDPLPASLKTDDRELTPQAPAATPQVQSAFLTFLKAAAHDHSFLFGLIATIIVGTIFSIPFILYLKL